MSRPSTIRLTMPPVAALFVVQLFLLLVINLPSALAFNVSTGNVSATNVSITNVSAPAAVAVSPYNLTRLLSSSPTQFSAGVTLGPNLTDPSICNQTRYLTCHNVDTPNVLTVYGAINSQSTADNLADTIQQLQAIQFYLDVVNGQGGVSIGNVSYLLSFHYQFDDGSENWLYAQYESWMGSDNSHIIFAPIEDELVSQPTDQRRTECIEGTGAAAFVQLHLPCYSLSMCALLLYVAVGNELFANLYFGQNRNKSKRAVSVLHA